MVGDDTSTRERTAEVLRSFLQVLLTPGLNPDIDAICKDRLGLPATQASVGFHRFSYCFQQHQDCTLTRCDSRDQLSTLIVSRNSQRPWCISGEVSASRALALIACLRALTHFGGGSYVSHKLSMLNSPSDTADHNNTVVAFYATSLSHTVGRGYVPPSLSSLARWWFDVSSMTLFT